MKINWRIAARSGGAFFAASMYLALLTFPATATSTTANTATTTESKTTTLNSTQTTNSISNTNRASEAQVLPAQAQLADPRVFQRPEYCAHSTPASVEHEVLQSLVFPQLDQVHVLATGRGQRVAVIDTGVARHPRLPQVIERINFLEPELGGELDCDIHGTVVAGIIGTRPAATDNIVGIAPDAEIISIRQSTAFPASREHSTGTVQELSWAIIKAVEMGVGVINLSVTSCMDPNEVEALSAIEELRGAISLAEQAGVVVVAAAGNKSNKCVDNTLPYPAIFDTVISVQALEDPFTLAMYNLEHSESLAAKSFSAPGLVVAGLDPLSPGFATVVDGSPITGTSFAAPWVSGMALLIRERAPYLTPPQVRELLAACAEGPHRALDPLKVLALVGMVEPPAQHSEEIEPPQASRQELLGVAQIGLALLVVAVAVISERLQQNRQQHRQLQQHQHLQYQHQHQHLQYQHQYQYQQQYLQQLQNQPRPQVYYVPTERRR